LVTGLDFSPDGKHLASCGMDSVIRLWEVATGKEATSRSGHQGDICEIVFAPDGKTLITGGQDTTVRVWDTATGKELRCLKGHRVPIRALAFSPDGRTVASGGNDRVIMIWDAATGARLHELKDQKPCVWTLNFSPDGKRLVSGGCEQAIHLWDVATGKQLRQFTGHKYETEAAAFSPDGRRIASIGQDDVLRVSEVVGWNEVWHRKAPGRWTAFGPEGTIITGASDTLRIYRADTGKEVRLVGEPEKGRQNRTYVFALSSDGKLLASANAFRQIELWNPANGKKVGEVGEIGQDLACLAISADGKLLAVGYDDTTVLIWRVPGR